MGGDLIILGDQFVSCFIFLESMYNKELSVDEGVDLVIKGISAAKSRDSASGGMIDVAVITKEKGFVKLEESDVLSRMKKLKLNL